jgi:hypothetical protein
VRAVSTVREWTARFKRTGEKSQRSQVELSFLLVGEVKINLLNLDRLRQNAINELWRDCRGADDSDQSGEKRSARRFREEREGADVVWERAKDEALPEHWLSSLKESLADQTVPRKTSVRFVNTPAPFVRRRTVCRAGEEEDLVKDFGGKAIEHDGRDKGGSLPVVEPRQLTPIARERTENAHEGEEVDRLMRTREDEEQGGTGRARV